MPRRTATAHPRHRCVHPYSLITFDDPTRPRCEKCKKHLPPAITMKKPPADLVRSVRSFVNFVRAGNDEGEQFNPRTEMQLMLQMARALDQFDAADPLAGKDHVFVRKSSE